MAFENLFIRTKRELAGIQLDAMISETHDNVVRLTKNPIELGADITDHAVIEPKRLFLVADVSDTPLGAAAFSKLIDDITGLFGTSTTENLTRSQATYNAMVQLMEAREPIEVQTKLVLYGNMIITGLSVRQDKDSSRNVLMNIALEEALITQSEIVPLTSDRLRVGSAQEQATSAENKGRQAPVELDEAKSISPLKSIVDWVFGK